MSADEKIKTSADKVPLNLVPLQALKGAARVFGYGAKKYSAGNYYTADDAEIANRYVGGFLRHLSDRRSLNVARNCQPSGLSAKRALRNGAYDVRPTGPGETGW